MNEQLLATKNLLMQEDTVPREPLVTSDVILISEDSALREPVAVTNLELQQRAMTEQFQTSIYRSVEMCVRDSLLAHMCKNDNLLQSDISTLNFNLIAMRIENTLNAMSSQHNSDAAALIEDISALQEAQTRVRDKKPLTTKDLPRLQALCDAHVNALDTIRRALDSEVEPLQDVAIGITVRIYDETREQAAHIIEQRYATTQPLDQIENRP